MERYASSKSPWSAVLETNGGFAAHFTDSLA
jgi:hypothetical protein